MTSLVEEHYKKKRRVDPNPRSGDSKWMLKPHSKNNISNEIIIYEILPWLPLESLFECKLVCKDWRKAILTDPIFKASQCQRSVTHCSGLIYRYSLLCDEYVFLDPSLKCSKTVSVTNLTSSSNGLLCGTCKKGTRDYFYVMNPITIQVVYVPNLQCFKDVAFAFEPLNCNPYFAIISPYDVTAERHHSGKVLTTTGFHVYTSQTGSWREANTKIRIFDRGFRAIIPISEARTVYVGEKVYWKIGRYVLWFHIKDDTGGTIDVPDSEEEWVYGEIGDCNGELTYCKVSSENVIIWVLMSCEKPEFKWVQKYSISFNNEIFKNYYGNFPSCCDDAVSEILDITGRRKSRRKKRIFTAFVRTMPFQGGDLLFWARYGLSKEEGVVFSYNMKTRTLQIAHNSQIHSSGHSFFSYKRSLASVPKLCVLDHAEYN